MALRGIQEYIARDVNNIALVSPEKEPSNIIIIIIRIGLCVSSEWLPAAILSVYKQAEKKRVRSSRMHRMIIVGHPNSYDKS